MSDGFSRYNQILVSQEDREDYIQNSLGHFHVCQDAIWFNQCWSNISKGHGPRICG